MAEVEADIELVIRDTARRMWSDFVARMDVQPSNKASFLAAVLPEIRKAFNERTEREGRPATPPVDSGPAVGGELGASLQGKRIAACEWGGGVCR
jgi:hypothetical protein